MITPNVPKQKEDYNVDVKVTLLLLSFFLYDKKVEKNKESDGSNDLFTLIHM